MPVAPTDGELILELQAGNLDALGEIYERYQTTVYHTALVITRDSAAAEDILQDCFLRLHRYAHRIDPTRTLKPWLYRVTVNLAYTRETRRRRWCSPPDGTLEWLSCPKTHTPDSLIEHRDIQDRVLEAISQLSFSHRAVIVLYYLNSLNLKEISQVLDCPVGTVKSRLHYGRESLYRLVKAGNSTVTSEMLYAFA